MNIDISKVKDIHEEHKDSVVYAGVTNLNVLMKLRDMRLPVNLTILVPTNKRGVHMSRLIGAVKKVSNDDDYIEDLLRKICEEINRLHGSECKIIAKFDYPLKHSDQFLKVKVELGSKGSIKYVFKLLGITACPCSKEITGIGHMQRAMLIIDIESTTILDFDDVASKMAECFSSVPAEYLKRLDEAKLILKSQENPRFVEDVVREALKRFSMANKIMCRAYESIHSHDAFAMWYRSLS
ncbi:MAG TPA: GTP cyclohydrolase, FolE2/MptA family [Geobacterales bacterium]|nr:GTP cyclohydrolase, FolE2/MptA family [Geobacterales bacterium]